MTSPTLRPTSPALQQLTPPSTPRNAPSSPRISPRRVTREESAAIQAHVERWKRKECDIDDVVIALVPESYRRKSYAKEVYAILMAEVRLDVNQEVLVRSRKSLYAASVFSKIADCAAEYRAQDEAYCVKENEIMLAHPDLRGGKL